MFIQGKTIFMALGALVFLDHSLPSHAASLGRSFNRQQHARSLEAARNEPRFAKRTEAMRSAISTQDVEQLQIEYTAFHGWVNAWLPTARDGNIANAVSQLEQDLAAYDSFMTKWLDSALHAGSGSSGPCGSSPPFPQTTALASGLSYPIPTGSSHASMSDLQTNTLPQDTGISAGTSGTSFPSLSGSETASYPMPTSTGLVVPLPVNATSALQSVTPTSSNTPSSSPPPSGGSGSFNPKAKDNVAVYYGQTAATSQVKLSDLCADKDTDIVILSFLTTFAGPGGYPTVNFGAACGGPASTAMTTKQATGLLNCPDLAKEITTCQSAGKKVMLSLGGALAESAFTSDDQATKFATQLWNLFGAGTGEDAGLRPFGAGVIIDGFDIDNENKQPAHYGTFVTALRNTFKADSSKSYYISAAPQCPTPDASIPLDAMKVMDFVWVQFFNNGPCNVGTSGFVESFKTWSSQLSGGPMLYIGAPACSSCAGSGYVAPAQIGTVIKSAMTPGADNMGGVMLWDGAEGYINKDGSGNYMSVVKAALG